MLARRARRGYIMPMRTLLAMILAVAAAAGCKKIQATLDGMRSGDTAPAHQAAALKDDVRKAEEARQKAEAAIQREQASVAEGLKQEQ